MNTKDTTPATDPSATAPGEPPVKPEADGKLEELKTRLENATPDSDLPQAQSDLAS